MEKDSRCRNSSPAPWPAVVFLLTGAGLQLTCALKYSGRPILLTAGSVLSFAALLLLRHDRQRRVK